jgi:hypothetical protein
MFPLFFVFQKVIALIMFKILCVVFSQICLKSFLQNNFMIFFKNFFAPAIFLILKFILLVFFYYCCASRACAGVW